MNLTWKLNLNKVRKCFYLLNMIPERLAFFVKIGSTSLGWTLLSTCFLWDHAKKPIFDTFINHNITLKKMPKATYTPSVCDNRLKGNLCHKRIYPFLMSSSFLGSPSFLGLSSFSGSSSFLGSSSFFRSECGTAQLNLLFFVLSSCCSRYVGFVDHIYLNDLIDDAKKVFCLPTNPSNCGEA